jgi:Xaa-Pro aminopeptidase
VGAFLSVHEGPQRLSRISEVPLEPGMILSNEPGYYREGTFGIRLENLIVVQVAEAIGDHRDQLSFETLTFAPFDRRLIDADQLSAGDRAWLNAYHAQVLALLSPRLSDFALSWAHQACEAL